MTAWGMALALIKNGPKIGSDRPISLSPTTKVCTGCKCELSIDCFGISMYSKKTGAPILRSDCIECKRKRDRVITKRRKEKNVAA